MALGSDSSVSETAKFNTTNNIQPVDGKFPLSAADPEAGNNSKGIFDTITDTLGVDSDLKAIIKEGAAFKLRKELGILPIDKKQVETNTVNKTKVVTKPEDKTVTKVLQTKAQADAAKRQSTIFYTVGIIGIGVIVFGLFSRDR